MNYEELEKHYRENRLKFLKKMTFRSGSEENAEDIIQEAYYRALKYLPSYDGVRFGQWFNTILNNCLKDFKNNNQSVGYTIQEDEEERIECPSFGNHVLRDVYELIKTKSLHQQEVLLYFIKYEYTAMDISRITEHSYAMCHKMIQRFREELKQLYGV